MAKTRQIAGSLQALCEKRPANAVLPASAAFTRCADVLQLAQGYLSLDNLVAHLHIERMRIAKAIGLPLEGPDACQSGYPDLAGMVEDRLVGAAGQVAAANQRAWRAEDRAERLQKEQG